jgi:hypothetical protein
LVYTVNTTTIQSVDFITIDNSTDSMYVIGDTRTTTLRVDNPGMGPGPGAPSTPTTPIGGPTTSIYLSDPSAWLTINISGTDYVIPAYL